MWKNIVLNPNREKLSHLNLGHKRWMIRERAESESERPILGPVLPQDKIGIEIKKHRGLMVCFSGGEVQQNKSCEDAVYAKSFMRVHLDVSMKM